MQEDEISCEIVTKKISFQPRYVFIHNFHFYKIWWNVVH